MNNIEKRTYSVRMDAPTDDESRSVKGYASIFNSESNDLGWFREEIMPGAFRNAIIESDVRALFNHDPNIVLGRTKSGTLRIFEDENGLGYEIPDMPASRSDVLEAIQRGDVDQSSFAFTIAKDGDEWIEDEERGTIRKIHQVHRLYDVSPVTYPAYEGATVGARSVDTEVAKRSYEAQVGETHPALTPSKRNQLRLDDLKRQAALYL